MAKDKAPESGFITTRRTVLKFLAVIGGKAAGVELPDVAYVPPTNTLPPEIPQAPINKTPAMALSSTARTSIETLTEANQSLKTLTDLNATLKITKDLKEKRRKTRERSSEREDRDPWGIKEVSTFYKAIKPALTDYSEKLTAFLATKDGRAEIDKDAQDILSYKDILDHLYSVSVPARKVGGEALELVSQLRKTAEENLDRLQETYGHLTRTELVAFAEAYKKASPQIDELPLHQQVESILDKVIHSLLDDYFDRTFHHELEEIILREIAHQMADTFMLQTQHRPCDESLFDRLVGTFTGHEDYYFWSDKINIPNYFAAAKLSEQIKNYERRTTSMPLYYMTPVNSLKSEKWDYDTHGKEDVWVPVPKHELDDNERAAYVLEAAKTLGYTWPAETERELQKLSTKVSEKNRGTIHRMLAPIVEFAGKQVLAQSANGLGEEIVSSATASAETALSGAQTVLSAAATNSLENLATEAFTQRVKSRKLKEVAHTLVANTTTLIDPLDGVAPIAEAAFAEKVGARNPAWTEQHDKEREEGTGVPDRK